MLEAEASSVMLKRSGEWGQPCLIPDTSGKSSRFSSLSKTCCVHAQSCPNLGTLWTVACHAPLSMVFSRQEFPRYQISSSRVFSQARYQTCASWGSWTAGSFFTAWAIKEAPSKMLGTVFFFFFARYYWASWESFPMFLQVFMMSKCWIFSKAFLRKKTNKQTPLLQPSDFSFSSYWCNKLQKPITEIDF